MTQKNQIYNENMNDKEDVLWEFVQEHSISRR
jgi:hypothetical protein